MTEQVREREDKFDVDEAWQLPDLSDALGPDLHLEAATIMLSSRYYDTVDQALLDNRVTLRKRTGDADVGWQLKVPDGDARTEIRVPATPSGRAVPRELADLVVGLAGGQRLGPVAVIDTRRELSRVIDGQGAVLAEIADDHVTATTLVGESTVSSWREVEVELVTGAEELLASIGDALLQAGARVAAGPSKLGRVLNPPAPAAAKSRKGRTLGDTVDDYLQEQFRALMAGDLALRRGNDPIHSTRVAARRYRSALRVFADVVDAPRAESLIVELAWYAGLLGEIRDRQVLQRHLDDVIETLPADLVLGPVAARIDDHLVTGTAKAREQLSRAMRGARYLTLVRELQAWHREPPFTGRADKSAVKVQAYLDASEHMLAKRLRRAAHTDADDVVLHRARKAGKRMRYTAELAEPVLGKPAARAVRWATGLQDVLGEHQDAVVASETLLRLGVESGADAGENAFTLGLLYAHEQERAEQTRRRARKLAKRYR